MPPASFKDELVAEMSNLRAFAISLSGSVSLADDLVQETLLRAWSKSDKFQPGTSLRAWLFTILRNIYYSNYRKRAREVQDSDGAYARRLIVSGDQESHLDLEDFRKALARLPIGAARSSDPRRRERPVLRGGRHDLRGRDRHDQEPPQPRPLEARRASRARRGRSRRAAGPTQEGRAGGLASMALSAAAPLSPRR